MGLFTGLGWSVNESGDDWREELDLALFWAMTGSDLKYLIG